MKVNSSGLACFYEGICVLKRLALVRYFVVVIFSTGGYEWRRD
jgi:hypothetical protein